MTDLDDEEFAPAATSKITGDRLFAVAGFLLATAAAFFPWYVFFNQESFGIAPMGYTQTRELPALPGRSTVQVSPLAIPDEADGSAPVSAFDPIITATVPDADGLNSASRVVNEDPNQSFPGKPKYRRSEERRVGKECLL